MKRFTSMFLAVCMLALPVSGCSQSSGAEASTSAASTASGDATEETITLLGRLGGCRDGAYCGGCDVCA